METNYHYYSYFLIQEEEISAGTDGTFKNIRLFQCPMGRAFFVPLYKCRKDKRFVEQQRATEMTDSLSMHAFQNLLLQTVTRVLVENFVYVRECIC